MATELQENSALKIHVLDISLIKLFFVFLCKRHRETQTLAAIDLADRLEKEKNWVEIL